MQWSIKNSGEKIKSFAQFESNNNKGKYQVEAIYNSDIER